MPIILFHALPTAALIAREVSPAAPIIYVMIRASVIESISRPKIITVVVGIVLLYFSSGPIRTTPVAVDVKQSLRIDIVDRIIVHISIWGNVNAAKIQWIFTEESLKNGAVDSQ